MRLRRHSRRSCGFRSSRSTPIAVAHRPGLIGSLLIGVTAAKTLAWALGKPLIGVDHVHAHLYSVVLGDERAARRFPAVGLVVQRRAHGALPREQLARRRRSSARRSTTPSAKPTTKSPPSSASAIPAARSSTGSPTNGDPKAIRLPALPARPRLARLLLQRPEDRRPLSRPRRARPRRRRRSATPPPPLSQTLADIAASFQAACVDVIIEKAQARRRGRSAPDPSSSAAASPPTAASAPRWRDFPLPVYLPADAILHRQRRHVRRAGARLLSAKGGSAIWISTRSRTASSAIAKK